jgi:hypothetical protein
MGLPFLVAEPSPKVHDSDAMGPEPGVDVLVSVQTRNWQEAVKLATVGRAAEAAQVRCPVAALPPSRLRVHPGAPESRRPHPTVVEHDTLEDAAIANGVFPFGLSPYCASKVVCRQGAGWIARQRRTGKVVLF